MPVFDKVKKKDLDVLKGFLEQDVKSIYEETRLTKNSVTLILYKSGKLVIQGKATPVGKLVKDLQQKGIGHFKRKEVFRREVGWVIGSDESLKGDTFGGIVVAAVKADDNLRKKLEEIGVADSKNLQDSQILIMAEKIKRAVPCEVKSLTPKEYNHYNSSTALLNKLHKECADFLHPGKHVVDQYPGCAVGDIQETKAESKYIEVAAASILARATAVKQIDFLSKKAGFTIPKGSTHVKLALHELKHKKLDPKEFVKMHFRNVQEEFNQN